MIPSKFVLLLGFAILKLGSSLPVNHEDKSKKENGRFIENTLRLSIVVMRHGERAPQDTYPNDPYINDMMEPYGWGQLTNQGRRSQYDQGLFLRNRYDLFLGPTYSPDIFYLQCTAVDRTKMSAMLEAAALWKPDKKQSFKEDLAWQPATLYYQPRDEDTLLLIWNTCPRYTKLRRMVMENVQVEKVQEDNALLYEKLTNITGMPIASPDDVGSLYSTLRAEEEMNLTLPEWTKDYYPDKMVPLTLYEFELNGYNRTFKRLKGGPLLKKIIMDMIAKKEGTLEPETRKMFMYVGHDSTIVSLLDAMHLWNQQLPHYNMMVMIELHEENHAWSVEMFLRNTTAHEPYPLTIPGCEASCSLNKFVELLKPMIPDDWEAECKVSGNYIPPPAPPP